jgi:POT family proton-dependent oligopeptide transporter
MGLSVVSKLSPQYHFADDGWLVFIDLDRKQTQRVLPCGTIYGDKSHFFWVNFGLLMFATLLMFLLLKQLNKVMAEKGIN